MPQFFVDKNFEVGTEIEIRGADARHIAQVLRLAAGDWLVLSDGAGNAFRATIATASPNAVTALVREALPPREGAPAPALAIALIKADRFEWAIQKAVELGCRRLIPFRSARTVPQAADAADERKLARWSTIAAEAAKQSGLRFRPEVEAPAAFLELIRRTERFNRAILLYEGERSVGVRELWGKARTRPTREDLVIVGPEGGFTEDEVKLAHAAGVATASLGPQILRVETAAVAALALWQYELGNMDAAGDASPVRTSPR